MRINKSPRRPQTQLLGNRGILTKINPVVRKKSKQTNTQVPPEWNEEHAQAYRLLVGPKISQFITPESEDVGQDETPQKNLQQQKKELLLSKLVPSRLKTPYTPFQVTNDNLEQLTYPSDLLVQVFPPDQKPKCDLLARSLKKKKRPRTTIVKPTLHDNSAARSEARSGLAQSPDSSKLFGATEPEKVRPSQSEEEEDDDEEEEEDTSKKKKDEILPIKAEKAEKKQYNKSMLDEKPNVKLQHAKKMTKLRTIFYILRCWAHYNMNARIKADYISDVSNTRKLLEDFRKWHLYVKTMLILRQLKNQVRESHRNKVIQKSWSLWKRKAKDQIINAGKAVRALNVRNDELMKNAFLEFAFVAHSRRICRRETTRFFRYQWNGPFTPINTFYTDKRFKTIHALHFNFAKNIPKFITKWKTYVKRNKHDRVKTGELHKKISQMVFLQWFDIYRDHFHTRVMTDVRRSSSVFQHKISENEREASEKVEKTVMVQLKRDRQILDAKLNQFDRLSMNHLEAVQRRKTMRRQISQATKMYFQRQEELCLIDYVKQSDEASRKVRELRMQLAEGFLYHLGRAARSYDNQIVAQSFCFSFRVLSEPLVNNAVSYFYEKRHLKVLVNSAIKQQRTLTSIVNCAKLYHFGFSWGKWRKFIEISNSHRSGGLMTVIRRRTEVMQLFPYFNWVEVLPVRPPRPLKEVEHMFKDLPLVSVQRKIARERVHHVNVRMMLLRRRMLRDFMRSMASYVQEQIAVREVMKLCKQRNSIRLLARAFAGLKTTWNQLPPNPHAENVEGEINSNIAAWHRHFFRARVQQRKAIEKIPITS